MDQSIFKSYDIRGIYPSELDEDAAFEIGRAFIKKTGAKRVVIGQDARLSCPALFSALSRGILHAGSTATDIGRLATECLYFSCGNYDFDAGFMITASHNPKEYNGFKMIKRDGNQINIIRGKDLLPELQKNVSKREAKNEANQGPAKKDIWRDYLRHILSFVDLSEITPLKIVVDASNGVAGIVLEKIKDKLPVEIIELNFQPNGNFPEHSPNPLEKGSSDKISQAIKKENADFGLIFDGDADRIFLIDETGQLVKADATLLILAKYFLQKNPGSAIAYNAICSKAVPEFVKKWGGLPLRTQVGFVNVRDGLLKNNGIMGGELSGHYCFKDNFYLDSGMIAFLTLLQIISQDGRKVSEIIKELSPYAKGAEINFEVHPIKYRGAVISAEPKLFDRVKDKDQKQIILDKIKKRYADGKQDFLDGITVQYKDWWFNVRPSNTEPLLRLTIEADTQDLLEKKQKELTKVIKN